MTCNTVVLITHRHYSSYFRYSLMLSCWNIKPDRRPSFRCLAGKLENILLTTEEYLGVETQEGDTGLVETER